MVTIAALCLAIGVGTALTSIAFKLDPAGTGVTGSLLVGASMAGVGWVGLGVGALAGQVTTTARGANGLGSVIIGVFYVIRMLGDVGNGALTWASPIGWGQQAQPWGANRWWPIGLQLVLAAACVALALWLEGRRDLGAGLITDRPGPASAPSRYASPLGLGLRQQRGSLIGWGATFLLFALMLGSVIQSMRDFVSNATPTLTAILGGNGLDAMLSMLMLMMGLMVAIFAIQSAVMLRGDEATGIIEPQLAGALSRRRWALERLAIAVVGSALFLVGSGVCIGAVYGAMIGDSGQAMRLGLAALAYWPAVMVLVGIAVALFGWTPRLTVPLTWGLLGAMWVVTLVHDALNLPSWVMKMLPFSATPYLPLQQMDWTPLVVMTLIACALVALGVERFARRDIQIG